MARRIHEYKLRTYALNFGLWLLFNAVAFWAFSLVVTLTLGQPDFFPVFVLCVLVIVYTSAYIFLMFHKERLRISSEGITYQQLWFTTDVKWKDITGIRQHIFGQQSLLLEKQVISKNKLAWLTLLYAYIAPLAEWVGRRSRSIPLGTLVWEKSDEIESQIRKYAPHLFT